MFSIFCDHGEMLPGEEYAGLADWSVVVVSVCPSLPSKVLNDERNVSEYFHSCCIVVVCGDICFDCNRLFIFLSEHVLSYLRIPTGVLFLALVSLNSDLLIFNLQERWFVLRTERIFSSYLRFCSLISSSLSLITHHSHPQNGDNITSETNLRLSSLISSSLSSPPSSSISCIFLSKLSCNVVGQWKS